MDFIGPDISALLKEKDWNQKMLAQHLGKSSQYVNDLYQNKKRASKAVQENIAACAEMTLAEFRALQTKFVKPDGEASSPQEKASAEAKLAIIRDLLEH
jgi:transcriptional regulator with XRE-family HTH domain